MLEVNGISNCPLCAISDNGNKNKIWGNKNKIWKLADMDADHMSA